LSEAEFHGLLIADDHPLFRGALREAINGLLDRANVAEAGTFEEVVDRLEHRPGSVVLPSWVIDAVACVPRGAHPSYAHGYYERDNKFYVAWEAISRARDTFTAWMREHVLESVPV
jgi:hypothetical protein